MKTTETDQKILIEIHKDYAGLTENQIVKRTNLKRITTYRSLQKMMKNGILMKTSKFPCIYQINKEENPELKKRIINISCPKCNHIESVTIGKMTKVCENCKNRYWITNKRREQAHRNTDILQVAHTQKNKMLEQEDIY